MTSSSALALRRPAGLRIDRDRATMAHLASLYPFHADPGLGVRGPYIGVDITGGMRGFHFDPFELYATGALTNPNCVVIGDVGTGKSALVKAFLRRELAIYGSRRWIAVLDPKAEYLPFARAHGLAIVGLRPGGRDQVNPMDGGPDTDDVAARQSLAATLVAGVLGRPLEPLEDALLGWAITALSQRPGTFTLADVTAALAIPSPDAVALTRRTSDELAHAATPVVLALDKLCTRTLAGMFDGPTTIDIDWRHGPGVVIDLSAVYGDDEALPLVMAAATTWLTSMLRHTRDRRVIQVVDEAWAAVRHGARHLQASLKLARVYGASTWLVCHRPNDLTAQTDDGTASAKIAAGLLADAQTRVVLRQAPDQIPAAARLLGLNTREAAVIGQLVRGRALWRTLDHAAVVQVILTAEEMQLFGTDAAMAA